MIRCSGIKEYCLPGKAFLCAAFLTASVASFAGSGDGQDGGKSGLKAEEDDFSAGKLDGSPNPGIKIPAGGKTPKVKKEGGSPNSLQKRLEEMMIDKVEFADTPIQPIISWIRMRSKELDPDGNGINILLRIRPENTDKIPNLNLNFENISVGELVRYICQMAGLRYSVEEHMVIISDQDPEKKSEGKSQAPTVLPPPPSKILERKLDAILDHVEFEDVQIQVLFEYIVFKSRELDPGKSGVNILLQISEESREKTITMIADDVPIRDFIRNICMSSGLEYRVEKHAVVIFEKQQPKKKKDKEDDEEE